MSEKSQQKQILFDVPIGMYDAVNTFVVNSGMTKKGLMQKLIKDFIRSHQEEFEKGIRCLEPKIGKVPKQSPIQKI